MPDKQPFPEALKEMVERDGKSLEEIAAHIGYHPSEVAKQFDLSGVTFPQKPDEPATTSE